MADLRLSKKLHVVRIIDDVMMPQAAANQFDVTVEKIMSIMQAHKKVESLGKFP